MRNLIETRRPLTRPEKREELYRGIEGKIAAVRRIWTVASNLPVPLINDTQETARAEAEKFEGLFQETLAGFPEGAAKFARYQKAESSGSLAEKWQLGQDDDVNFLLTLRRGSKAALERREEVRGLIRERGIGDESRDKYGDLLPKEFKDQVKYVIAANFSLNFVINDSAFSQYFYLRYNRSPRSVRGFHLHNTPFNILRDRYWMMPELVNLISEMIDQGNFEPENLPERKGGTLVHEDFHSFIEGFLPPEINFRGYTNEIEKTILYRKRLRKQMVRRQIDQFTDLDHEELLAELVSSPPRERFPRGTFVRNTRIRQRHLSRLRGIDPQIDRIIEVTMRRLDIKVFRERVSQLFRLVKEKAPERKEDLEAAFALFKPSQIRHVKRLVERWTIKI